MKNLFPVLFMSLSLFLLSACGNHQNDVPETQNQPEPITSISDRDYLHGISPDFENQLVNAVIEIPAGSNAKWEVNKESGHLEWEVRDDAFRVINYLPYPANYGFVPQSWLPADQGGDDDPIDIFVLGPRAEIGSEVRARVIGVVKMIDHGEQDDKLLAVDPDSWFGNVETLAELETEFPGIVTIITTWLESYKGPDADVEITGVEDETKATNLLQMAIEAYQAR